MIDPTKRIRRMKKDFKDFVFIDAQSRPYYCKLWEDEIWLFRWNDLAKHWISLREVTEWELPIYEQLAIPEDQAKIYHDLNDKFTGNALLID